MDNNNMDMFSMVNSNYSLNNNLNNNLYNNNNNNSIRNNLIRMIKTKPFGLVS